MCYQTLLRWFGAQNPSKLNKLRFSYCLRSRYKQCGCPWSTARIAHSGLNRTDSLHVQKQETKQTLPSHKKSENTKYLHLLLVQCSGWKHSHWTSPGACLTYTSSPALMSRVASSRTLPPMTHWVYSAKDSNPLFGEMCWGMFSTNLWQWLAERKVHDEKAAHMVH